MRVCQSSDMLDPEEAKEFVQQHTMQGRHKAEKCINPLHKNCAFWSIASKSLLRCKGRIRCPVKLVDESYSNSKNMIPTGSALKEKDCPRTNETRRRTKFFANKVRINNSTLLKVVPCVSCNKEKGLFRSRNHSTKESLE